MSYAGVGRKGRLSIYHACKDTLLPARRMDMRNPLQSDVRVINAMLERNTLRHDSTYKGPHRFGKAAFHESNSQKKNRLIRLRRWRLLKQQCKNTSDMALWMRFRVNATTAYDQLIYRQYLRKEKREQEERRQVNDCLIPWSMERSNEKRVGRSFQFKTEEQKVFEEETEPQRFL